MRLNKFLRDAGIASRRRCDELITQGRVVINGVTTTKLATLVDCTIDRIELDGSALTIRPDRTYVLLNKPPGYLVSRSDPQGRPLVSRLLPRSLSRVFSVGRLDYNTEGALLLTDHGELAHHLVHPRYHVGKTYRALVQGHPGPQKLAALRKGIMLDNKKTLPAQVKKIRKDPKTGRTLLEICLTEGRNRQVRRMCTVIGHPVKQLIRTEFAGLKIKGLPTGTWRYLTEKEITKLKNLKRNHSGVME